MPRSPKRSRIVRPCCLTAAMLVGIGGMSSVLGGCQAGGVGWSTYPPTRGQARLANPNRAPVPQVMAAALRYTLDRYPPQAMTPGAPAEVAINLPDGVNYQHYTEIAQSLSTDSVFVYPLTPDTASLPTYHVAQVRVRGGEAEADVLRPVFDLGTATGGQLPHQGVTLELQGGLRPWDVTRRQVWAIGTIPVPAANYLPAPSAEEMEPMEDIGNGQYSDEQYPDEQYQDEPAVPLE